jgi:hypothetical protein
MDLNRVFVGSKMNKSLDERLLPNGQYTDALNIRISSDEDGEAGSVENAKGNELVAELEYDGAPLTNAVCIGAYEFGAKETIFWFVTSDEADIIASYNQNNGSLRYHVVSTSVLNFNPEYLINGIDLIDDMLFFTDNYNQPRRININKTYPMPVNGVDEIEEDDISVIVKPPVDSPTISLITQPTDNNYMEDRFIRFAYRYRYENGEYSALSQFSEVAFLAGPFSVDLNNYDQTGMTNLANAVNISFNTGAKQVVGIDLCFKLSHTNVVHVIERFDKEDKGWGDNDTAVVDFDNQKIYTTLPDDEILRRFDNVPKKAKAQTSMANRIFYGNYVDGYDVDTVIDYDLELISDEVRLQVLATESLVSNYTIETNRSIDDSTIYIDLTGIELVRGASISIDFNISHDSFIDPSGNYVDGNEPQNNYREDFVYVLPRDYNSIADLVSDPLFTSKVLSSLPFASSADGYSLTDQFYTNVTAKSGWTKVGGGIDSDNGDFDVFAPTGAGANTLAFQVPAIKYEDNANPGVFAYEYFKYSVSTATFSTISSPSSLHSDRGYEVGIEYMDEYNRSTTTLVNDSNSVFVPANRSTFRNNIQVKINNEPPSWASRYRLLMKPDKQGHDTIYTNFYYFDDTDNSWWFLLEGDNQTKCKVGDTLFVKSDSNGATNNRIKVKVLDIDNKERNFISDDVLSPPGVYMKLRKSGFDVQDLTEVQPISYGTEASRGEAPVIAYPTYVDDDTAPNSVSEYGIGIGSKVRIKIRDERGGSGSACGSRKYVYDKEIISTRNYDTLYDFLVGENFDPSVPSNNPDIDSSDNTTPTMVWDPTIREITSFPSTSNPPDYTNGVAKVYYVRGASGGAVEGYAFLGVRSGNDKCNGRRGKIYAEIEVYPAGDILIFETEPLDYTNDIFFEGHKSYPIVNGLHTGDIQNQTPNAPAVAMLDMFNCYSFGNGAESMKISDELDGFSLTIGERVSAVSNKEYKESHRGSDITYSGVYNDESNINGLNEFNLALGNFKTMERNYGDIQVLHARETNILVLQEDRISYVLQGKNILSDAVGGSSLTSIPQVLGNQVPFPQEHGISNNPESFASYGSNVYFTDAKRGCVLKVNGQNQLDVLSNYHMRSWFRDEFIGGVNTIKLGGYDPFSDEYVLSIKDDVMPVDTDTTECGFNISQTLSSTPVTYNVDIGSNTGAVNLDYNVAVGSIDVSVSYNGTEVIDSVVTGNGTLSFNRADADTDTMSVTITPTNATYSLTVGCPVFNPLSIIRVVKNNSQMAGDEIHHSYIWDNGNYQSSVQTDFVTFGSGPVSLYIGNSLTDGIPPEGSTIRMRYTKQPGDTAEWEGDKFKYLVSDTLYTEADINTLTPLLQEASPINNVGPDIYEATFTYSNPTGASYLYLVWDYVEPALECSDTMSIQGEEGTYEFNVSLGDFIGNSEFTFDMGNAPARAELIWDGNVVADSLFVGDGLPNTSFENNIINETGLDEYVYNGFFVIQGSNAVDFDASDIADTTVNRPTTGDGSVGNQIGVVAGYPSGTPLASDGQIKLQFNKTTATPQEVTIRFTSVEAFNNFDLVDISCPTSTENQYQTASEFYSQTWDWKPDLDNSNTNSSKVVVAVVNNTWYLWIDTIDKIGNPVVLSTNDANGILLSAIESNFETIMGGDIVNKRDYVALSQEEYFIDG